MRTFSVLLAVLGLSASARPADTPLSKTVTRAELRRQLYLYNGWMLEVQDTSSRDLNPFHLFLPNLHPPHADLLPITRVLPALMGQQDQRTFTLDDINAERLRLSKWIDTLSKHHVFLADSTLSQTASSTLPHSSVALHFRRPKFGSTLARDFGDERDSYSLLNNALHPLVSSLDVIHTAFKNTHPGLNDFEIAERIASTPMLDEWRTAVRTSLTSLEVRCARIGFPMSFARELRMNLNEMRNVLMTSPTKLGGKLNPDLGVDISSQNRMLQQVVRSTESICREAEAVCERLQRAYSDPHGAEDPLVLELAWCSIVPVTQIEPTQFPMRLKQASTWLAELGVQDALSFESMYIASPTELALRFRATESFWDARKNVGAEPLVSFEERLFYKFNSALGTNPASLGMSISGGKHHFGWSWHRGKLIGVQGAGASVTVGGEIQQRDLRAILSKTAIPTGDDDAIVDHLSKGIRDALVKEVSTKSKRVAVVHDEPGFLLIRVSNARNLILEGRSVWEDVDINFIITKSAKKARLLCIVDGRWAPGLGEPKSIDAFRDMEPAYSKQLNDFAGQLLVKAKRELLRNTGESGPTQSPLK